MYNSILTNAARIQAEPLNGHTTQLHEALEVAKFVLLRLCHDAKYILQVLSNLLHKRDKGVTKTETPERVSAECQQSGRKPCGCGSYISAEFHFGARGFWKSTGPTRPQG